MNNLYSGRAAVALLLLILFLPLAALAGEGDSAVDRRVAELLDKMTLEEKIGQMNQVTIQVVGKTRGFHEQAFEVDPEKLRDALVNRHVGSLLNVWDQALTVAEWTELITLIQDIATKETRLGIPVLYGIDAIHGANYIRDAALFPQSLAMAATFNPELVRLSAEVTARDIRAAGMPWNFNPVLGIGRSPLWPRLFETFGEDPYTVSEMAEAYVKGIEGPDNTIGDDTRAAACMKHYLGYSFPLSGKDRTPAWIPERILRDVFLPPFQRAVEAGVHTVMVNSGEINGIPTHSDYWALTEILRKELGFKGFVVSDWEDVKRLYDRDRVAVDHREAVKMAVMAGIDMSMVPYDYSFADNLISLVKDGEVPESRIDEAVGRILRVKFQLGLFEDPYPVKRLAEKVGSAEDEAMSLEAARQVITLLKNEDGFLPLKKNARVLVAGPTANRRSVLNGGWSYVWQGDDEWQYPTHTPTVLGAIEAMAGADNVSYVEGTTYDSTLDIAAAVKAAKGADVAVLCIGEDAYCETPGNIHDLNLPQAQLDLVAAVQATGTPTVLVLIQGRPRVITPVVDAAKGILYAYLPGPQGPQAIAEVLYGEVNPSGKLPITYPRSPNDLVTYDHKPLEIDDPTKMSPLWPFGHGLSYTEFSYSDLTLDREALSDGEAVRATVTVTNSGDVAGRETVHLFLSDLVRTVSPPVRQVRGFTSVTLKPGESKTVSFDIDEDALAFHDRSNRRIVEAGEFSVQVGGLSKTFTFTPSDKY